jgi:hypothetical protein
MSLLGDLTQVKAWKFIYASYILYMRGMKVVLVNIFSKFVHDSKFHGMEFSICGIILYSKCFGFWHILGFGFWILG